MNTQNSTESGKNNLSAFTEILNSFRIGDTPTQSDLPNSFTIDISLGLNSDFAADDNGVVGNVTTVNSALKFKPIPPILQATGKPSKNLFNTQQAEKVAAQQAAQQRFEPNISVPQLQLVLNACKLLDLAIILPSDTLPIFQLHRWSFVGDAISFHTPNGAFDFGTLFSASASSAAMINDINAMPISSRHLMEDNTDGNQPSSMVSLHSSHSASNFAYESDSTTIFDSLSLNSHISDSNFGGSQASSLPPTLSSSTSALPVSNSSAPTPANRVNYPNFIPHIVFLNSLLNYLSVS